MKPTDLTRLTVIGTLLVAGCGGTSFTTEDAQGGSSGSGGSGASGGSQATGGSGGSTGGTSGSGTGGSGATGGFGTGGSGGAAGGGGALGGSSGSAGAAGSSGAGGSSGGQSGAGGDAGGGAGGVSGGAGDAGAGGCGPCPFVACLPPVYAFVTPSADAQARPIRDLHVESPNLDVHCTPLGGSPCQWTCMEATYVAPGGDYEMTFSAPGFESQTVTFSVTEPGLCGCCACGCPTGYQGTIELKANDEEPGACCADTATDPTNCGSCGNDCNGAACTNGTCG